MYKYKSISEVDQYGNTQLMRPSKMGNIEKVKELLKQGCDPNKANTGLKRKGKFQEGKGGITPLFLAMKHKHQGVIEALIDGGAE